MHLLTICLYEFPAANYDVQHWAERFSEAIEYESSLANQTGDANIRHFRMKRRTDKRDFTEILENVYCVPSYHLNFAALSGQTPLNIICEISHSNRFKIVLVGSFNSKQLHSVLTLSDFLKSCGSRDLKND